MPYIPSVPSDSTRLETVTHCVPPDLYQTLRQHFDNLAPEYDRWKWRNRYYHHDLKKLVQFFIPPQKAVLEIGCGNGDLLAAVQPTLGIGVDFSPRMIALAQSKYPSLTYPHLEFYCAIAEHLTLEVLKPAKPLDYILISETLGSLVDIQQTLQQLSPFCHRHTRLILTFHNFLWQPLLRCAESLGWRCPQPQESWLSMTDVKNLLQITGFVPTQSGRRFLIPKAIPFLSGLINRYVAPLPGINHLCLTHYIVARKLMPLPQACSCSIVVPARNEAGNIAPTLNRIPRLGQHTEVIFVEGNSQDNTWEMIQSVIGQPRDGFTLKAFQQQGRGKADAVRLGFAACTGDILMILDADLTVQPEDLRHFWEVIQQGQGEFINGSRLVYPRSSTAMPWLNMLANKFFSLVFSFLLGQPIKDTLCGTKVLWREDFQRMDAERSYFGDFDPFGDFELLFGAARFGLQIVDVPVRYQPRSYGQSNIAHVREGMILLKMCWFALKKIKFIR